MKNTKMTLVCKVDIKDDTAFIDSECGEIFLRIYNKPINPNIVFDFAVWIMLPLAMRIGANLQIEGTISESTKKSAEKIASIWSTWLPGFYEAIEVSALSVIETDPANEGTLSFFSGGVDSTYSVLKAWNETHEKVDALTVHGMDYRVNDKEKFEALIEKTRPVRELVFNKHYYVQTNAYQVYNRYRCNPSLGHVTFIFTLFGAASLFDNYEKYRIAADVRLDHQFIVHPYGSNSATNRLMRNATSYLKTMNDDVTRSEKVSYLANLDSYLNNISFCDDYDSRPHNCGVCSSCIRTKAYFLAATGSIPPIFKEKKLPLNWYKHINRKFFLNDILSTAQANNFENKFPSFYQAKKFYEKEAPKAKEMTKRESLRRRVKYALQKRLKRFGFKTNLDRIRERLKNKEIMKRL